MRRALFLVTMFTLATGAAVAGDGLKVERGTPGTLGESEAQGQSTLEVRGHEDTNGPALDVLNRAGVAMEKSISAAVIHNYGYGPGLQIDQVGEGSSALVLKQARNGIRMPESGDKVSDASFLSLTRAGIGEIPAAAITTFDQYGNLRYEADPRQDVRSIRTLDADLLLNVGPGHSVRSTQPIVFPRVDPETATKLLGATGLIDGKLSVWNGSRWHALKYEGGATQQKFMGVSPEGKQLAVFDLLGNLRYEADARQDARSIRAVDADLLLNVGAGHSIRSTQPFVFPRVETETATRLVGATGLVDNRLAVWDGSQWQAVRYKNEPVDLKLLGMSEDGAALTRFDSLGNLRYEQDPSQQERSIAVNGANLRFVADDGNVIIAGQPLVVPRVSSDQPGRLFGAMGMLDGNLATFNGEKWLPLKYVVPEDRRAKLIRYTKMAIAGGIGGGAAFFGLVLIAFLFRRRLKAALLA